MSNPRILFMGHDLVAMGVLNAIPEINETKGFGRGKLSPSDMTLEVKNFDNEFSVDNPKSFLYGTNWQFSPIIAYDSDDNLFANCIVADITRNHVSKMANIICKDIIFANRKTAIAYTSTDWETSATAAYNIMIQEGLTPADFNNTLIQNSISQLTAAACYVKVNILKEDDVTLLTAIEKLGPYGGADVFMYRNKICYQHWQAYTGGVSVFFDYDIPSLCPRTAPIISTMESSFYNDYSIGYNGDLNVPATDAANGNIGAASRTRFGTQSYPEMRCNSSSVNMIAFKDLTSAKYIGETFIKYGHSSLSPKSKILQVINFNVDYSFRKNIDLGSYFKNTFSEEGWTNKVFEVAGIKRSLDKQEIAIEGWEVKI
jgi:hypothetical protein